VLYAAKCYWPEVSQSELEQVAARASSRSASVDATYVGSLLFADDDLALCLFEAPSRAAVKRTSEQAGIPCERVMAAAWLKANPLTKEEQ
jgi:Nickel responsive protein SCO4226-like